MNSEREAQWEAIKNRTQKLADVMEACRLMDIAWHDLSVTEKYLVNGKAITQELKEHIDAVLVAFGEKSDKWSQWTSNERTRLDAAITAMEGEDI